jgi:nucleoside-diphosphate-sugar epimerase/spore maturation protein CgeB
MKIVVLGLSITSSWGNGHATTYRGLLRELARLGHEVSFLERDAPRYAATRDLPDPTFCTTRLYADPTQLRRKFTRQVAEADAVILGSYVPDGIEVGDWLCATAQGVKAFYDIDTPVTLARLARNQCDYLASSLIPHFDLYLSFTGGPTLRRIEEQHGARAARALYCSVDARAYCPVKVPQRHALGYLGTYSADRQPTLRRLLVEPACALPEERFAVAGPKYPSTVRWPGNVERIEHLAPPDHPAFYCAQRFTLNVTRADMVAVGYSPSVRLFEAAACGVPIVSDWWEGLDEMFRIEDEILIAESGEDVVRLLRDCPEARRRAIGRAARARVLREHTAEARARELERHLTQAAKRRPASRKALVNGHPALGRASMVDNRPKTILVTGGAGFIGSHLCEALLRRGRRVTCLDNFQTGSRENIAHLRDQPGFTLLEHDVTEKLPPLPAPDAIYNLACAASPAQYRRDPVHTLKTCALGALHLLELARATGARILQASSSEVYGDPEVHPQPETYWGNVNPIVPRACYDEGKRAAEALFFDFHRCCGVRIRVARIFNTYGPRMSQHDGRIVSNFIVQALLGRPLTVFGDGRQIRSFCYVDDMVRALAALMDGDDDVTGPINLGNSVGLPVLALACKILELTGSSSPVRFLPLPTDDPGRRQPVIERARARLGWAPVVALEDGLAKTIEDFARRLQLAQAAGRPVASDPVPATPKMALKLSGASRVF